MRIKESVVVNGMKPEIMLAVTIANSVYEKYNVEMVVTSITDSKHGNYSRHYLGLAVDLRVRNIPDDETKKKIFDDLKSCLGKQYNVLDEKTHFHISYKPL